jgi:hypothetical protein
MGQLVRTLPASHPVLVHRLASLLHASFRPHLAARPLRFAITSPPSGCEKDFHLRAVEHARHTRGRDAGHPTPPSRPGEFHPEPLTEPCVTVSSHTARAIHRGLPPSATTSRFLLLPVDQVDHDANGLPPSLRGHYSASSLLRDSPPLPCVSVLSASRGCRLCLFPYHRRTGSQVPYQSQD